jgi:hypothetical protein
VQVRTDDEVYRIDAVWLGPPKATFPWRARYVAWGVGILMFLLVLTGERMIGFGFGFFTVAWALVITVVLTRLICSRISHERPLGAVFAMWVRELNTPRESSTGTGGAASATRVRVHSQRPRPRPKGSKATAARVTAGQARTPTQGNARGGRGGQRAGAKSAKPGRRVNKRVNQQPRRAVQPARGVPQVQYVQHAQGWAGQPANDTLGGAVRPRSKEVGGVRTPGRK